MLTQIFMLADKSTLREAMLLFWDEDIAFLGHTKWNTKHSGNNQRGTVKDTRSQVLEAVNISAPVPPPLSLSLSFSACRGWYTGIFHPVLTSRVYCFFVFFYLFKCSLITIHSVKKNSTRRAVGVIFYTLWWNAPMFYHLWCQTNAALMRTSANNPLFSSNCTTWSIHVRPTWSEENILAVLHIILLDLQFRHIQRHVREHVNIFQCPLHVMDACHNCVTMDAMAGNQGTKQKCTN